MSNIYEALQYADRTLKQEDQSDIAHVANVDIPSTSLDVTMEQEMIDLYRHIDALLPDSPKMVLQFISSRSGEGVSTIVREYAAMSATRLGKSVLILDMNQNEGNQQHFFRITNRCGWDQAVRDPEALDKAICRIGDSNLYLSGLSRRSGAIPLLFNANKLHEFFVSLKTRFDLVLLDSSPVTTDTDSAGLSRCADGVVLVVEAEKSRCPVAENTKAMIQKNGGNILGLVFNKRRYYIPKFIYSRL